jgi:hypothetical protein
MGMTDAQRTLVEAQGFYLTGEDNLRVTTFGALAGVALAIEGRRVDEGGAIVPFAERHVPNSDYSAKTTLHQIGAGSLLNAHVRVTAGAVVRGHVFVLLEVVRGLTGAIQPLATLAQGYVSATARLAWPGSVIESSVGGLGRLRLITGTNPAAGVEILETVPAGVRWLLRSFAFNFTASGVAANRVPVLTIDDGAAIVWEASSAIAVTAGQLAKYRAGAGLPFFTYDTRSYQLPLPEGLALPAGARIRTVTAALDVGDDYAAPIYGVEEFIE